MALTLSVLGSGPPAPLRESIETVNSFVGQRIQDGLWLLQGLVPPAVVALPGRKDHHHHLHGAAAIKRLRPHSLADVKEAVLGAVSVAGAIAAVANASLSPRGPGTCDRNGCERCCNIITSAPYAVCGCHAMRHRQTSAGKAWGASMVGVACASALFHGSSGSFREWGRRLDFWTISAASSVMNRAVFPGLPPALTAATLLATPFKPFLVSTVNTVAMELKFLERAYRNPELKGPQRLHAASCILGLGAFVLEEFKPDLPLVHSFWHCMSSVSVATINHLLADVEAQQRRRQGEGVSSSLALPAPASPNSPAATGLHRRHHRTARRRTQLVDEATPLTV
ncbi:hypothetical protein HYH03_006329 [Edaphochlamys debaryana]|uniref:Uncharacterized protein n=1 Tax=Edaphochlamys debaryana TaxID=47281 RepID=A0A836C0E0_9CHLO|nr:hypothetical protein HYH03_006329 [Edaphochlamys debaryana]|eukprot:KAG2495731.1 hypothetical protein HYH03_006329 [Edaphochlamys debaryana]